MDKKTIFLASISLSLFLVVTLKTSVNHLYTTSTATITFNPPSLDVAVSNSFTLNLSISNVVDLYLWVATIEWNSTVLELLNYEEGSFLKQGGNTTIMDKGTLPGRISELACTLLGEIPGVNGSGTPVTFTFNATTIGTTPINITFSDLLNSEGKSIIHNAINGTIEVKPPPDIAVTNVTPYKTVVGQGYSTNITVTVENQGDYTETFNVSVFYDDTVIILPDGKNHTTTTLPSGNSTILIFTWNTTGVVKGNYTITATATQLPGETDTTDNNLADGWVFVTIPGDINGDKYINIKDAVLLGVAFGSKQGEPSYNPNADINSDGFINIKDAVIQGANFGKSWT